MANTLRPALNSSSVSSPENRKKKALSQRRDSVVTKTPSLASSHTVTVNDLPVVSTVAPAYNAKDSSNVTDVFSPQSLAHFVKPTSAKTGYRVSNPTLLVPGRSKAVTSAPTLKAYDLSVRDLHSYISNTPAISVVIPMFNAAEYIAECLESIFLQTFQDFEVIVVDDYSTDNSVQIVESYAPKFNGRLHITHTETNSGGGGYVPRNIGFKLARGEYIYFMDADDFILLTALEMLYEAAKNNDADVVYTSAHYQLRKPNDVYLNRDGTGKKLAKEGLEDEPFLTINNPDKNLRSLIFEKGFTTPWTQFVRRDFLIQNEITFPEIPKAGDYIWVIQVYCHAKRFFHLPTPIYFYRLYNVNSVSQVMAKTNDVFNWISAFNIFAKQMLSLSNRIDVLKENPAYRYEASRRYFEWCLNRTDKARKELSNQEIHDILYREFAKDVSDSTVPFFISYIDSEQKLSSERLKTINTLQKELDQLKKSSSPAISVIIPLYNAEKYLRECLDSLLAQTFQNFELIMVDDCSTDSSCEIVKSYMPKFGGERLKLYHMDANTGSGAMPRNKGLTMASGEYVYNMDNDDMLTKTALEEMYTLAKKYSADVVYCEKYYESDPDGSNIQVRIIQKGTPVDKPTLEPSNLKERVQRIIDDRYWVVPWSKLIRRNLLVENEIFFPALKISDDNIWNQGLVFYAKRFLRVPNMIYIYRLSEDSIMRVEKTPQEKINFWLNPVMLGLKTLDALMARHEFFKANPSCRIDILKKFITTRFEWTLISAQRLTEDVIFSTIKDEFSSKLGEYDVLIAALCTILYDDGKAYKKELQEAHKVIDKFTARIDVKFAAKGDFQIHNVSDDKATIKAFTWNQNNGTGYQIQSYAGKLEFIAKAAINGRISLVLMGINVKDPENKTKRLPYWIDYTRLTVNGKTLFDTITPAWHDEPHLYKINAKAGEEVKISVEWLPHMDGNHNLTNAKLVEQAVLIHALCALLQNEKNARKDEAQIIDKFSRYFTARIDLKLIPKSGIKGDFQILSMSDSKAKVSSPAWFQSRGKGYVISSYAGNLNFVAKASVTGKIQLTLLGLDVRDPKNKSKHIPYWIDYTKLAVNGKMIFDEPMPCWHNEPYSYNINVQAGEEIEIQVEWLPHRSNH